MSAIELIDVEPESVGFWVPSRPRPKGSPQVITRGKGGRPLPFPRVVHDTPQAAAWQKVVAGIARGVFATPIEGPVLVELAFVFERAKGHWTKRGALSSRAPSFPGHNLGDVDKLARSTLDGLQDIAFKDDTQVVRLVATKRFQRRDDTGQLETAGCMVNVASLDPTTQLSLL